MLPAIRLQNNPLLHAGKINNESTNRMLPAELDPAKLPAAQQLPQPLLRRSRIPPQLANPMSYHRQNPNPAEKVGRTRK
jgi:hypothetical protein